VALAQLFLDSVLLPEAVRIMVRGVSEYETRLVEDRDHIAILEFPPLVPAYDGIVDERAVAGDIFKHGNDVAVFVLGEKQTVSVGDGG
jgi:hypothetical protein